MRASGVGLLVVDGVVGEGEGGEEIVVVDGEGGEGEVVEEGFRSVVVVGLCDGVLCSILHSPVLWCCCAGIDENWSAVHEMYKIIRLGILCHSHYRYDMDCPIVLDTKTSLEQTTSTSAKFSIDFSDASAGMCIPASDHCTGISIVAAQIDCYWYAKRPNINVSFITNKGVDSFVN